MEINNVERKVENQENPRYTQNKYQSSLDNIGYLHEYDEDGDTGELLQNTYEEDFNNLQELIDICLKPNVINTKLDHIQDVLNCCYETDSKGTIYDNEWNADVKEADEYLQDIKHAYSFRVEDTRIVNELKELLGVNVDFIKKRVEELLKKELENDK